MWRSISEADCLAHYQKVDGANPSSAISVIEDLTKKKDAKNADPDPGFHHPVRNGKKRGNSMGEPVRAEVVLCILFVALLGLISRSWQSKRPTWRNWQRNCPVSRGLQVRFLPSALGQWNDSRCVPLSSKTGSDRFRNK